MSAGEAESWCLVAAVVGRAERCADVDVDGARSDPQFVGVDPIGERPRSSALMSPVGMSDQNMPTSATSHHHLRKLDIVQLKVADWAAAVQWYQDILGLRVTAYEEDDQYCWLVAQDGGARLGLHGQPGIGRTSERPRCLPSFLVDDLDSTLRRLAASGISPEEEPSGEDEGYRSVEIRDPEGNLIELYEWIAR